MLKIETETDMEHLRQIALVLEAANKELCRRIERLEREVAKLKGKDSESLELEIKLLKEELCARQRALFAASSERRSGSSKRESSREPAVGHGPREQEKLPVVEEIYRLDEADRVCPKCGGELIEWDGQYEEAEEVDVIERSFRIVIGKRQKYRCRCGGSIETALGPPKLIAGGRYSIGFAAEVAIAKYADHGVPRRHRKEAWMAT